MTTSTYEKALKIYRNEDCPRSLATDILLHLHFGYVFCHPGLLVLGRPISKGAPHCLVVDPSVVFHSPDTWMVYLGVGHLVDIISCMPYELPWFAWQRNNILSYYRREQVERIAKCITTRMSS